MTVFDMSSATMSTCIKERSAIETNVQPSNIGPFSGIVCMHLTPSIRYKAIKNCIPVVVFTHLAISRAHLSRPALSVLNSNAGTTYTV